MSKKDNLLFDENIEKITTALDKAVPKGSKSYEVVYALCILLAHIFIYRGEEDVDKDEYIFALKNIISDTIEEIEKE